MDPRIYTPLSSDPNHFEIRLLHLLPSSDRDALIHCSLFAYPLIDLGERPHQSEALSYVWGDPKDLVSIMISGQHVEITSNLHAALKQLRDCYLERILWIDALYIDQGRKDEVASQILLLPVSCRDLELKQFEADAGQCAGALRLYA